MSDQKSIDKAWNAYEILLFSLCHPPSFMLFWCVFDSYGFGAFLVLNWCGFQSRIDKASKPPQKCTNIGWKTAWTTEDDVMNTVRFHKCFMLYLCCFRSIRTWCTFGALSMHTVVLRVSWAKRIVHHIWPLLGESTWSGDLKKSKMKIF